MKRNKFGYLVVLCAVVLGSVTVKAQNGHASNIELARQIGGEGANPVAWTVLSNEWEPSNWGIKGELEVMHNGQKRTLKYGGREANSALYPMLVASQVIRWRFVGTVGGDTDEPILTYLKIAKVTSGK